MKYNCYIFIFILSLALGISAQYDKKTTTKKEKNQVETQTQITENQTTGKYRWPLNINNGYSSSFQEFRSNHFHAGCDLRTYKKTGYPVYAIADGYIYKIRMVKRGSGRGLYLKHDDGNTSIYFHLDRFEKKLEELLKRVQQLNKKKYFGNYFLKKPLRYNQGQIIGYSGETGSGFPHLHLEIRDKHYAAVNPFQLIQFPARDNNFPVLNKLLIRNRDHASINGTIGETLINFQKKSNGYYVSQKPLLITGGFDVVLNAYDISDTGKRVVPYAISVFIDDIHYFQLNFDRFEGDDNNQLGFVYDMYYSGPGSYFFNLFSQEGFVLEKKNVSISQVLENLDHGKHTLRIMVTDNHNNISAGVVPFHKVQKPGFIISNLRKNETGEQLLFEIEKLVAEPSPPGEIEINVFDFHHKKISSGTLDYHRISETKPLILKGVSDEVSYIDFDFYAHKVLYFKKRYLVEKGHLAGFTDIDFDIVLNRDEVFLKINHSELSSGNLVLKVIQGEESQLVEPQCGSDYIYFRFKPLNLENRVLLHFSILKDGEKVVEIQKKLDLIYLKEGIKQAYKYHEFEAYFGIRSVYEPRVLRVEERNYGSEYPVLSRQVS
ncbi:MAG: M23 family metallopeptidase, partial [Candidatus Aminicenantes bacterium]